MANKVWSAPVDSFRARRREGAACAPADFGYSIPAHRIGEVGDDMPDMLLGEDFFLSHRIYVAYSQRKLYFTYNGGPLFNLNLPQFAPGAPKPPASPAAIASQHGDRRAAVLRTHLPTPMDSSVEAWLTRPCGNSIARLSDLTRACDLAPQRRRRLTTTAAWSTSETGQFKPALQDFSTAITLQPDDIDARLARADLLQSHPDIDPTATPESNPTSMLWPGWPRRPRTCA